MRSPLSLISLKGDRDSGWNRSSCAMSGFGGSVAFGFLAPKPKSDRREFARDEGAVVRSSRVD